MIKKLHLTNFKNFRNAELNLGPLTLLVGTNASGKSNLRDAFRLLQGVARSYSLAEIFGAKYGEDGELQWRGIRGGIREITYTGESTFALEATIENEQGFASVYKYHIEIAPGLDRTGPKVVKEWLEPYGANIHNLPDSLQDVGVALTVADVRDALESVRFFDLYPEAMRQPSFPGQMVLGDRGEHLSSVLQAICQDRQGRQILRSWLHALTGMDAADFEFPSNHKGQILASLVEKNGQRTSADSASDGTLRFLAMIAAFLGPDIAKQSTADRSPRSRTFPARGEQDVSFYFFEELDSSIHPTRLHLLLQLIEQQVSKGKIQVVATTHSPALLRLLSPDNLENVSVIYRAPESPAARIIRLLDLPEARRLVQEQDVAALFAPGWLEDAIAFQDEENLEEG